MSNPFPPTMLEVVSEILTKRNGYYNSESLSISYRDRLPSKPGLQGIVITSIISDIKGNFKELVTLLEETGLPVFFDQVQSERLRDILILNGYVLVDKLNNTYQK